MKWYYTVLIVLVIIIVIVLIIDKLIFDGSFGKLILNLTDAKKDNNDTGISEENLSDCSDNELNLLVLSSIQSKYSGILSDDNLYYMLNEKEKTFYVIMLYEIEFQNGGLCQYFVNSSKDTANYLSDELKNIGAYEIERTFVRFVDENKINLNALSEFETDTHEKYMTFYELYPFEEFDSAAIEIYRNENLESMLADFIRENVSDFIN